MLNNQGYQRLVYLKIQGPKIIHIENNVNLKKRNFTVKNRPYTLRLITNATKIRTWNLEQHNHLTSINTGFSFS